MHRDVFKEYTEGELKSGYYPCIHNLHGKEKGGWGDGGVTTVMSTGRRGHPENIDQWA